jgi:hypothetical protein
MPRANLRRSLGRCGFVAVVAMVGGVPSVARADHSAGKSIAEALFQDAKQRLESGDVDGACPKFQDSQKVDPALGTLLYLAICHERQGRSASAWSEFASAASWADRSNEGERGELARKHMAALETRLWRLTIHAPATPIPGLEMQVDGGAMSLAAVDTPLPLDPGDHAIQASAPGRETWHSTLHVPSEAGGATVQIPDLDLASVAPPPESMGASDVLVPPAPPSAPPAGSGRAVATWSGGVLGVAGLAMGTVFGVLTFQEKSNVQSLCPAGACRAGGMDDIHQAHTDATISTVAFSLGIAGGIVATYFLLQKNPTTSTGSATGRTTVMVAPAVSPRDVGFVVQARFE